MQEVLLNRVDAATKTNVFAPRRFAGALQRDDRALGHEVECGSSFHGQRWPCMVCEHEDRYVIDRVLAPPPAPAFIWPGAPDGPKHVSSQNPRADVMETPRGVIIVDAGFSCVAAKQVFLKGSSGERPGVQRAPTHTQWIVQILVRSSAKAIERNGETFYAKFGHAVFSV